MLIRAGNKIINLDNVMQIDLDWDDEGDSKVVFEFVMRGSDELDEGENIAHPYVEIFDGEEAEALRKHLKELCPDLLA
jgi:hypothetical protein